MEDKKDITVETEEEAVKTSNDPHGSLLPKKIPDGKTNESIEDKPSEEKSGLMTTTKDNLHVSTSTEEITNPNGDYLFKDSNDKVQNESVGKNKKAITKESQKGNVTSGAGNAKNDPSSKVDSNSINPPKTKNTTKTEGLETISKDGDNPKGDNVSKTSNANAKGQASASVATAESTSVTKAPRKVQPSQAIQQGAAAKKPEPQKKKQPNQVTPSSSQKPHNQTNVNHPIPGITPQTQQMKSSQLPSPQNGQNYQQFANTRQFPNPQFRRQPQGYAAAPPRYYAPYAQQTNMHQSQNFQTTAGGYQINMSSQQSFSQYHHYGQPTPSQLYGYQQPKPVFAPKPPPPVRPADTTHFNNRVAPTTRSIPNAQPQHTTTIIVTGEPQEQNINRNDVHTTYWIYGNGNAARVIHFMGGVTDENLRPSRMCNPRKARMGFFAVLSFMTTPPVPDAVDNFMTAATFFLLIAGMVLGIIEFSNDSSNATFKLTALITTGVEILFVIIGVLIEKFMIRAKTVTDKIDRMYIKSVIEEVIGYISLALTALSVAADRAFHFDSDMNIAGMVLVIFDIIFILAVYIIRFLSIKQFFRTVDEINLLYQIDGDHKYDIDYSCCCCKTRTPGFIVGRYLFTTIGNFLAAGFLLAVVFMHALEDSSLLGSTGSFPAVQLLIFCVSFVILPVSSFFLFIFINYFWVTELMNYVLLMIASSEKVREKLAESEELQRSTKTKQEQQSEVQKKVNEKILEYAYSQSSDTLLSNLENLKEIPTRTKLFYATNEKKLGIVIYIWGFLMFVMVLMTLSTSLPFAYADLHLTWQFLLPTITLSIIGLANLQLILTNLVIATKVGLILAVFLTACLGSLLCAFLKNRTSDGDCCCCCINCCSCCK